MRYGGRQEKSPKFQKKIPEFQEDSARIDPGAAAGRGMAKYPDELASGALSGILSFNYAWGNFMVLRI
jgi:hypothetical protein